MVRSNGFESHWWTTRQVPVIWEEPPESFEPPEWIERELPGDLVQRTATRSLDREGWS